MYKNVKLQLEQSSYKSHPNYLISDHKPVTSEFAIRVSIVSWGSGVWSCSLVLYVKVEVC